MMSVSPVAQPPSRRLLVAVGGACLVLLIAVLVEKMLPMGLSPSLSMSLLAGLALICLVGLAIYLRSFSAKLEPEVRPLQHLVPEPEAGPMRMEVVDTAKMDMAGEAAPSIPPSDIPLFPLDLLLGLDRERFEQLCFAYFREKGIRAQPTSDRRDGGFDIRIYQDTSGRPKVIVQCRAGTDGVVDLELMNQLLMVMTEEQIEKGFFLTRGSFTDEARAFGQRHRIFAIDGKLFVAMIDRLPHDTRARLLALASEV